MFLQLLVYGLQLGCIYALVAIGYTMVYGVLGMINFAHGDFLMIGAFAAYFLIVSLFNNMNPVLSFILVATVSMFITACIGMLTERIAYKPLRNAPKMTTLITALAVSMFLQNFPRALPFIGPNPRNFPEMFKVVTFTVGKANVTNIQIIVIAITAVVMVLMDFVTTKTVVGRDIRAVSMDKDAASLMGVNTNRVISITFLIGSALAALAGLLYSNIYPIINIAMGGWLGTKAFICAVFGGIGSIRGAMLGGLLMGIIEVSVTYLHSGIGYGISFVILVLVLLVRPQGLIGKKQLEKV